MDLARAKLETLQELRYAEGKHTPLIVLRAMGTPGKGAIAIFNRSHFRRATLGFTPSGPITWRPAKQRFLPPAPLAPWHVIPANNTLARSLRGSGLLIEALEGLRTRYPEPDAGAAGTVIV